MRLTNLFANARDVARLESENKDLRARLLASEERADRLFNLVLERDMLMTDRFLTSQAKTYAITDEAKANISPKDDKLRNEMLEERLAVERDRLVRHAKAAGLTSAHAEATFAELKPQIEEDFNAEFGFNN